MPLFEQSVPVSEEQVSSLVNRQWNVTLGSVLKASQNHTFSGQLEGRHVVVRVTPDPTARHLTRIRQEIAFVNYLSEHKLKHVCAPIPTLSGEWVVHQEGLTVVVSEWALGEPVDFFAYRWMTDEAVVKAWGKWLAECHCLSREFARSSPAVAQAVQRFDTIHNNILADCPLHADDITVMDDPDHFGVIHGDLNPSNFFVLKEEDGSAVLSVFDWDQTQRGWFLWDLAQACFTVYMVAGSAIGIDGKPTPQAKPEVFEDLLLQGYEQVLQQQLQREEGRSSHLVDRQRLQRMIAMKKYFYETFCRKAKAEGNLPKDMEYFINYIVDWFDREKAAIKDEM
eukprot:gene6267-6908_t